MSDAAPAPRVVRIPATGAAPIVARGAFDTVHLITGERLPGRILRIDALALAFQDAAHARVRSVPLSSVEDVVLPGGIRVTSAALATPPASPSRPSAAERFAGVYRMKTLRSSVTGDPRCADVAARMTWGEETLETVEVTREGRHFRLTSRPGVRGLLLPSGAFESDVVPGERNGTRSVFRMTGYLTPAGFEAIGETHSETTLRWRRTLTCRFLADLVGTRIFP